MLTDPPTSCYPLLFRSNFGAFGARLKYCYNFVIMDAVLLIALDNELDLDLIKMVVEQMGTPIDDIASSERHFRARNENYMESIVPLYSNNLFKEHFRMSRVSFEISINEIGNTMISGQNNPVDLNKKVMFTIWMLAKPESFLSVGDRFGIAKSTGHGTFSEINCSNCKAVVRIC